MEVWVGQRRPRALSITRRTKKNPAAGGSASGAGGLHDLGDDTVLTLATEEVFPILSGTFGNDAIVGPRPPTVLVLLPLNPS